MTRVDRAGSVIDAPSIPLPGSRPDVAFDGENFLVAAESFDQNGAGVRARRVRPDGTVLDPAGLVLSEHVGTDVRISFDGRDFLVVWIDADRNITGARLSRDGVVLQPARVIIEGPVAWRLDLAFNGSHHLLVWDRTSGTGTDVHGSLLTPDGTPVDPELPITTQPGDDSNPSVTSVGDRFFVAWDRAGDILGTRIDPSGAVLDPAGITIGRATETEFQPDAGSDGTNVLVVWSAYTTDIGTVAHGARVAPSGTVLDPNAIPLPVDGHPTTTYDGHRYLVVGAGGGPVRGARLTTGGAVLDPAGIDLSIGANTQTVTDAAFDGTNTLVIWNDNRDGAPGVYGGRVGPDGQILDGTGFRISDGQRTVDSAIAFDGTNFLVTWTEVQAVRPVPTIRAARVTRSGTVLDRIHVTIVGPQQQLSGLGVTFGGATYLIHYTVTQEFLPEPEVQLRAVRVSPEGVVADPVGFLVTDRPVSGVDVASDGTDFLFVWSDVATAGSSLDITGLRVTPAATIPDPDGLPISTAETDEIDPTIAWNGDRFLVAWTQLEDIDTPDSWDIHGARISGGGELLDPTGIAIATGTGRKELPVVSADGPFLVTWTDRRRGELHDDLFGSRVDADGTVAHPDGFAILVSDGSVRTKAVVAPATGENRFTVLYGRFLADAPYGTTRALLRSVSPK